MSILSWPSWTGPPSTLSLQERVDLLQISVHISTPLVQSLDILPSTNPPSSNIQSQTVNLNRQRTHPPSPSWQPPHKGIIHQSFHGKINKIPASRKNSNSPINKNPVDSTTIIQKILRKLHSSSTQRRISDSSKRRILQRRLGVSRTNYWRGRTRNTPNCRLLTMPSTTQGSRRIQIITGRHISRGIHSRENQLETQHSRRHNNDSLWRP